MKRPVDPEKLRVALRGLSRGNLLIVADRALELVPRTKLHLLVHDMMSLDQIAGTGSSSPAPLLDEVQKFDEASRRGQYFESFFVNSKNFMDQSKGTEAFIAEFDRLVGKCVRAASKSPRAPIRQAFDVLFGLLRQIDENTESIVFFAHEAGAWQLGIDWRAVMPAYFRCLAEGASPGEFAGSVDRTITDFDEHDRPRHLEAARKHADAAQKAALKGLPPRAPR